MKKSIFLSLLPLFGIFFLNAQGYQAINGSPFAGSTGIFNNPAASVNTAHPWDLTLFAIQLKASSHSFYVKNFQISGSTDSASLTLKDGYASRFLHTTADVSLLNFSCKIGPQKAFSIGLRGRSYNHLQTGAFNYVDSTVNSIHSFLIANRNTPSLDAYVTHTGWLEADLNYAQVLVDNCHSKLTGGITLQIMKGLSGAFTKLNKISYLEDKNNSDTSYTFTNGSGSFGFSDNYDQNTVKDFLKSSRTGLAFSIGMEYLSYNPELTKDRQTAENYDWKLGVSIMDIGANSFIPNRNSGQFYTPNAAISDVELNRKLTGANNMSDLRDSLNSVFGTHTDITDNFTISLPTRLIANFDKNLGNHFYLNGEVSMNFFSAGGFGKLKTRELNLLTVTPRYETRAIGAYLPVQLNAQGQLWVGAAVKLGPLLLGVHNLGIFRKDPTINGGGYLMLSLHPFSKKRAEDRYDCPQ